MNSQEQYQKIIDEAYENYSKEYEKDNSVGLSLLVQRVDGKATYRKPDKEQFVAMCTHDNSFSERWGLVIKESYELIPYTETFGEVTITKPVRKNKILVSYKNKIIEVYE